MYLTYLPGRNHHKNSIINNKPMNNYNTDKFPTVYEAASAVAAPFIAGEGNNTYSYTPILDATIMRNRFGLDSIVWTDGGPDIGFVIDNSEPAGFQASVDCSGFVARVLDAVLPAGSNQSAYADIVIQNGQLVNYQNAQHPQPFPSAKDYAEIFAGITQGNTQYNRWSCTTCNNAGKKSSSLNMVQPGDILTYSLQPPSKDTGHVMVIASIQQLQQGILNNNYWPTDLTEFTTAGLSFYAVSVYDASNVLHHNDTRKYPATGIGQGTILLIADSAGVPLAFQFNKGYALLEISPVSNTANLSTSTLQILAVGRCI